MALRGLARARALARSVQLKVKVGRRGEGDVDARGRQRRLLRAAAVQLHAHMRRAAPHERGQLAEARMRRRRRLGGRRRREAHVAKVLFGVGLPALVGRFLDGVGYRTGLLHRQRRRAVERLEVSVEESEERQFE